MGLDAVDRMAMVMSALVNHSDSADYTLNDVCEQTGLARSTASRFLNALVEHDYVYRSAEGTFSLGVTPNTLSQSPLGHHRLAERAHPHIRALADDLQEAVCISVLDRTETQTIYQVGVPRPVFVENWVGRRWPILSSGSAVSIMSTWSPTAIEATVAQLPKKDRAAIADAIKAARENPISWSADNYVKALTSVAAPIVDGRGHGTAAVIIYGPSQRFPSDHGQSKIEKKLNATAQTISEDLY